MRKVFSIILVVLIICFSSCSSSEVNKNNGSERTTASRAENNEITTVSKAENNVNTNNSDSSSVINIIDNPIIDINNPAYCLGKQVSVAENFFDASFICDDENWLYYGNDSVFVSCDLNTELIVAMEIELYDYDLDYLGLKLNMSYDNVCSVLKEKGYRIKTDENKVNLFFAEQTDYYTGLCAFDNDDALQEIVYFVNTNEISSWIAVPNILNNVLDVFSILNENAIISGQYNDSIVAGAIYGNKDGSVQICFDMNTVLTEILINDNPNYFVFGVRTGLSLENAQQVLSYSFTSVGENVFKDSRGCIVKLLVEDNIVNGISLSFE